MYKYLGMSIDYFIELNSLISTCSLLAVGDFRLLYSGDEVSRNSSQSFLEPAEKRARTTCEKEARANYVDVAKLCGRKEEGGEQGEGEENG